MSVDVVVLASTAVLATVALVAAVVATRASRRILRAQGEAAAATARPRTQPTVQDDVDEHLVPAPRPVAAVTAVPDRPEELAPRVVEGRVVVPPSRSEVVGAAMSRPQVRFAVLVHGLATALRPESRDRIAALVRREYRERRRHRLRAGRRASRAAHLTPTPPEHQWLGGAGDGAGDGDEGRAIGA